MGSQSIEHNWTTKHICNNIDKSQKNLICLVKETKLKSLYAIQFHLHDIL